MELNAYLVVKNAYADWTRGDLDAFGSHLAPDVDFEVPSSTQTRSFLGQGHGRATLVQRLRAFLESYEVRQFAITSATPSGDNIHFRVAYDYRSRSTGLDIQGVQRHFWTVRGNEITSFTVLHDAPRLGAFLELTADD
jgi:ketosteroid isomerase-like protein